jgi:opacity protein-like surface antigen
MRTAFIASAILAVCSVASTAHAQSTNRSIQGFGGITFGTSSTPFLGGTSTAPTFGGTVVGGLLPNLQVVGEFGRMSDIKPPLFDLVDEYSPAGLHVTAWYGEGGVRWIASPHSSIRPYGEATAGWARLNTDISGFSGRTYEALEEGLGFLNRTDPLLGVGGGVVFQSGPVAVDIGYRYKKILASGVASALNGGDYHVNDVRVGVGFSF